MALGTKCYNHGRAALFCLECFPRAKAAYPKGYKACQRCKDVLIEKSEKLCIGCTIWEERDWLEGGPDHRAMMHAVILQCQ